MPVKGVDLWWVFVKLEREEENVILHTDEVHFYHIFCNNIYTRVSLLQKH